MDRRNFILSTSTLVSLAAISSGCATSSTAASINPQFLALSSGGTYELPPLTYGYDSLEPYIDTATMKLHHDTHHAAYVKNLNGALQKHPELSSYRLETLLADLSIVPEDIREVVRNHGGGHFNHSLFWTSMSRKGQASPSGDLGSRIDATYGSLDTFKTKFQEAGMKRFGSGWVWLVKNGAGQLSIMTTPNQDTPLAEGFMPLVGNDLWEHAYYLKYQSKRGDYLAAWWNLVDWAVVEKRYQLPMTVA